MFKGSVLVEVGGGCGCTFLALETVLLIFKSVVVITKPCLDFNNACTSTCVILLWNAGPCLLKPQISLKTVPMDGLSSEFAS